MKTYKTFGIAAVAWAALVGSAALPASAGDISKFKVVNQDGQESKEQLVTVQATPPKVIRITSDRESRRYNENETASVTFTLSEPFTSGETGYLFLVPQDADSSNLVECAQFETGLPIRAGYTSPSLPAEIHFLDGKPSMLNYSAVLRDKPNFDEGIEIGGFSSGLLQVTVSNVVPRVIGVSMNGMSLFMNGSTMLGQAIQGMPNLFRIARVDEPSVIDLTNEQFMTEWKFYSGNGRLLFTTNVCGSPYVAEVPYAFPQSGMNTVTVRVKDKDTTSAAESFTFQVETLGAPTISMTPSHGSTRFLETDTGSYYSRINVNLSIAPTDPITVRIDIDTNSLPAGVMVPVLNTHYVNFSAGATENYFYITDMDGDMAGIQFSFKASVTNETIAPNSGGKTWKEYYTWDPNGFTIDVLNAAPQLFVMGGNMATNYTALKWQNMISWRVSDVLSDMTNGLTSTWTIQSEGTVVQPLTNVTGQTYSGSFTFAFTKPGPAVRSVVQTLTDKDGGSTSRQYYYFVDMPSDQIDVNVGGQAMWFSTEWIGARMGVADEWVENNAQSVKASLEATAANGRLSVVECYALGIDPEAPDEDFVIREFNLKEDGTPDIENVKFSPSREKWTLDMKYKVKGKARLSDEWQDVPSGGGSSFRFFKLVVEP